MSVDKTKVALRDELFVGEYLKDLDRAAAALRIGFNGRRPYTHATMLLRRPYVRHLLSERAAEIMQRNEVTVERIAKEAAAIAFSDPRALVDSKDRPRRLHELSDAEAAAVGDLEFENVVVGPEDRQKVVTRLKKLKRQPKVEALTLLARYKGMLTPEAPNSVSVFNIQINL